MCVYILVQPEIGPEVNPPDLFVGGKLGGVTLRKIAPSVTM